jgi:hypothetical protein
VCQLSGFVIEAGSDRVEIYHALLRIKLTFDDGISRCKGCFAVSGGSAWNIRYADTGSTDARAATRAYSKINAFTGSFDGPSETRTPDPLIKSPIRVPQMGPN